MREIINAIQNWNRVKNNAEALKELFDNKAGFVLKYELFPTDSPLHVYAAINKNVFGFYIISEVNDIKSDDSTLVENMHWHPCIAVLENDQEITEKEALLRIDDWKNTCNDWIDAKIEIDGEMYQNFYIPTTDLQDENYMVYFGLKNNNLEPTLKAADLVLKSTNNLYFDTVLGQPPYVDRVKYYILDLL